MARTCEHARQQRILRNQQVLAKLGLVPVAQPESQDTTASKKPQTKTAMPPTRRSRRQQGQSSEGDGENMVLTEAARLSRACVSTWQEHQLPHSVGINNKSPQLKSTDQYCSCTDRNLRDCALTLAISKTLTACTSTTSCGKRDCQHIASVSSLDSAQGSTRAVCFTSL